MMETSIKEEIEIGKTYTCEQLRDFIAYDQTGSVIFCKDSLISKDEPQARFTVKDILEGYISRRRNDYKDHYDTKQKIYIVVRD